MRVAEFTVGEVLRSSPTAQSVSENEAESGPTDVVDDEVDGRVEYDE